MKFQQFYNHIVGFGEAPAGFVPAGRLNIHQAFKVYQDGYTARLTESLGETYESVWKFLGDEDFFSLSRSYIEFHPSHNYNINHYGSGFAPFLASAEIAKAFPFLEDLAKLDWLRSHLFHQATEIGLDAISLAGRLSTEKCVSFTSSFVFFESKYSIFKLWSALQKDAPLDQDLESPETLCLFKRNNQVFLQSLPASCCQPLNQLQNGATIETALNDLADEAIQQLFKFFSENRIIRDLA